MNDDKREQFVEKINWYKSAIANTKSEYLKRDYQKAIKRMQKELREYDRLHKAIWQ
jgi:hypothetical protein